MHAHAHTHAHTRTHTRARDLKSGPYVDGNLFGWYLLGEIVSVRIWAVSDSVWGILAMIRSSEIKMSRSGRLESGLSTVKSKSGRLESGQEASEIKTGSYGCAGRLREELPSQVGDARIWAVSDSVWAGLRH